MMPLASPATLIWLQKKEVATIRNASGAGLTTHSDGRDTAVAIHPKASTAEGRAQAGGNLVSAR